MADKLRVWHMPQVGCNATFYVPVESLEEASHVMAILSCYDIFQLDNRIKPDFCNTCGVQKYDFEEDCWLDWDSDEYSNFEDYLAEDLEAGSADEVYTEMLFTQLKKKEKQGVFGNWYKKTE